MKALMKRMAAMTKDPLDSYSHQPEILPQTIVPIAPTKPASEAPDGMIKIPGGQFDFIGSGY